LSRRFRITKPGWLSVDYANPLAAVTGLRHCCRTIRSFGDAVIRPFPFVTLSFRALLLILLAIDVTFILANVLAVLAHDAGFLHDVPVWLKVTEDREPPEDFNYLKWTAIAVALFWVSLRDRWLAPALWGIVFVLILLDDSLQIHENFGGKISTWLGIPDNTLVYGSDLGEMIVFGVMGSVALVIGLFLLTRRDEPSRLLNKRYILVILALGFCGVGFDAIHSVVQHVTGTSALATLLQQVFGLFEDGGEMLVGSFAAAITLAPQPDRLSAAPKTA
jgi:hypothetical protein